MALPATEPSSASDFRDADRATAAGRAGPGGTCASDPAFPSAFDGRFGTSVASSNARLVELATRSSRPEGGSGDREEADGDGDGDGEGDGDGDGDGDRDGDTDAELAARLV